MISIKWLWIYFLLVDLALMTLGILGFGVQITYDSQLTTPWNISPGFGAGTISKLYSTNQSVMYNNRSVWAVVDSASWGQYEYFQGFWTAMDVIYNMSQSLGKNNTYNLVISFFNSKSGQRGWSTLFAEYMSIRSLLVLMGIAMVLQCVQMMAYGLYHLKRAHRFAFTIALVLTKVIYLIAFSMYFLYLHNRNFPSPDSMPTVLSGWLISTIVTYLVFLLSNSFALWLLPVQNTQYEALVYYTKR